MIQFTIPTAIAVILAILVGCLLRELCAFTGRYTPLEWLYLFGGSLERLGFKIKTRAHNRIRVDKLISEGARARR
jgi:hypothetical protein